ncbi:MAG: hypothetical protein U1E02_34270, partial [Hydrogenophaga sp.]|nr:hypothetical protein [Hydrogenophaga sp.]
MMQVCAVALSHINVSSRGRLVRTESASGNTGYVLQINLPYPISGVEVLALQCYLRRSIESVMGLQLREKEFLLQVQDVSAVLPMSAERLTTDWLARRMADVRRAHAERVIRETAEAEQARRAKVVPLMRNADPAAATPPWPTRLSGSEFMSLESIVQAKLDANAASAQQEAARGPVRSGARKLMGKVGLIDLDDLARPRVGQFAQTDIFVSAHGRRTGRADQDGKGLWR